MGADAMISDESKAVAEKARQIYETQYRDELEQEHDGKYLCIEPTSGQYFLGETLDQAVNAAIDAFPDRLTYTIRIGHPAALHLGTVMP
jgi:hypothetical protein